MPELPDITIFTGNLKKLFAGKQLSQIKVLVDKRLKDKPQELTNSLKGQKLTDVFRSGKEMRFQFANGAVLGMHLMLTGDIFTFDKVNDRKFTIAELHFTDGSGIALTDFMKNAAIKLNPVDKDGIDALDKKFNVKYLKSVTTNRITIKDLLLDQNRIRGIGNAYSDEILWETRISPFSVASAIPDEKLSELIKNIKKILKQAISKISKHYPNLLQGEVKEFLKIHTRKKPSSPTGYSIIMHTSGGRKTFYTSEQILYK